MNAKTLAEISELLGRGISARRFPAECFRPLRVLKEVGFREADVLWKEGIFALYGGFNG